MTNSESKGMRRVVFLLALISLLAGATIMVYAYERAENLLVSRLLVVPAVHIPSYTVIRPEMLAEKEFPRTLVNEPLYTREEELVGKITTVPLQPGQLVYHSQAVPQSTFRLTGDPALEVLSFPVDPSRSVAGQIQIGHRVTIYRLVTVRPQETEDTTAAELRSPVLGCAGLRSTGQNVPRLAPLFAAIRPVEDPVDSGASSGGCATGLAQDAAAVEVLAENVWVVDARPPGQREGEEWSTPAHILTVAVPHETAVKLIRSAGGQRAEYDLWVSLIPAVTFSLANAGGSPITPIVTPHIRQGAGESE